MKTEMKLFFNNARKPRQKALSLLLAIAVMLSVAPLYTIGACAATNTFTVKNDDGVNIEYQILDSGDVQVSESSSYSGNVTIPEKVVDSGITYFVTAIGDKAFYNCTGLTSITIPDSVTSIGDQAFYHCIGLTSIPLPSKVTSIGNFAFGDCSSLTSITLPDSMTSISNGILANCSSLTSVTLSPRVTSIGDGAFMGCGCLTGITLPDGVKSIGNEILLNCSSLKSVNLPNSVTSIGYGTFWGCGSLTSIALPAGIKSIGWVMFADCSSLTSITLPTSVTSIGDEAFEGCSGLTSITLPASVTSICREAFLGCSSLTSITLPDSVTSLGDGAFLDCSSLENAYFDGDEPTIGDSAFSGCSNSLNFHCADDGDFSKLAPYGTVHKGEKTYSVTVASLSHGSVTPSTEKGMPGETISLTVKPEDGYALVDNSLSFYNADSGSQYPITGNSFTMLASNVTVTAAFKETFGGSSSNHDSSHTSSTTSGSTPSLPSTVKDLSSRMEVDLSGVTFSPNVTGITFSVTPETKNGDPKGESGSIPDLDGKAAYNLAVSDADLNVIGTPSLYKLKLLDQNGNDISSFSGKVTIKIPVPIGHRGTLRVFRYESDRTLTDMNAAVENGFLVLQTDHFSDYIVADTGDSITLDTTSYQMPVGGKYQIGIKLTGDKAATAKVYSTNNNIAIAAKLKNGNVQVNGKGVGTAYIMVDVYDKKNNLLSHASVRVEMIGSCRPHGNSTRQVGVY